jgi:hypothetical protein
MNAPATLRAPRAEPFSPKSYAAFRVCEIGDLYLDRHGERTIYPRNTFALPIGSPPSLSDALAAALTCDKVLHHKDRLVISETDERGARLHIYAIRKAKPRQVHIAGEVLPRRVEDLYPELVCTVDAGVLALGLGA